MTRDEAWYLLTVFGALFSFQKLVDFAMSSKSRKSAIPPVVAQISAKFFAASPSSSTTASTG